MGWLWTVSKRSDAAIRRGDRLGGQQWSRYATGEILCLFTFVIAFPQLQDRFAEARATPPIDPVQNWFLISGEEKNGTTTIEFWRNFSSCDARDREIGKV